MKKPLELYEKLLKMKESGLIKKPKEFENELEKMWLEFYTDLNQRELILAQQFRWMLEGQQIASSSSTKNQRRRKVQKTISSEAKLNRMLELFWQSYQNYLLRVNNHNQLVVTSQDGTRSIALPIKPKSPR